MRRPETAARLRRQSSLRLIEGVGSPDGSRWSADDVDARRYVACDNAVRAHRHAVADVNATEHNRTGAEIHVVADHRCPAVIHSNANAGVDGASRADPGFGAEHDGAPMRQLEP